MSMATSQQQADALEMGKAVFELAAGFARKQLGDESQEVIVLNAACAVVDGLLLAQEGYTPEVISGLGTALGQYIEQSGPAGRTIYDTFTAALVQGMARAQHIMSPKGSA